ncbi:MAG: hypothetical protein QM496_17495 [Verrucomicrobiota bacterium]
MSESIRFLTTDPNRGKVDRLLVVLVSRAKAAWQFFGHAQVYYLAIS